MAHSFKFQLISDVHLEMHDGTSLKSLEIPIIAPYLVLAGDIGYPSQPSYRQFLHSMASEFTKVFVIAGNHEFYYGEYNKEIQTIRQICSENENLVFLNKDTYLLEETDEEGNVHQLRILGTTLWSNIPIGKRRVISFCLNDYHVVDIKDASGNLRKLNIDDTQSMFRQERVWLAENISLARENGEKVLVITHHAPHKLGTSAPEHTNSPANDAFSSDLRELMGQPVSTWFFGHTHYSSDQQIPSVKGEGATRLTSNQMGYPHENLPNFDPGKVFEV